MQSKENSEAICKVHQVLKREKTVVLAFLVEKVLLNHSDHQLKRVGASVTVLLVGSTVVEAVKDYVTYYVVNTDL